MSRRIRIFQVDAFTTERFTGNPAGVVLDADGLTDAEMLAIARELNNADTAFVLKPEGADHELRVRFFTPRTEASFVGHATVATHFVLSREGAQASGKPGRIRQRQKSGIVDIEIRGEGATRRVAVRQPAPPLGRQLNDRERLAVLDALALSTGDIDTRCPLRIVGGAGTRLMIGVRSTEQLKQLKPDFSRLTTLSAQLGAAGFFVFTLSHGMAGCLTESRMFCPALGIPEDPVSGNAHGLLGAYLAEQGLLPHTGDSAQFTGAQGHHLHRAGRVDVELEFTGGKLDGVWIVGQAVEIFETEMTLYGNQGMRQWATSLALCALAASAAHAGQPRMPGPPREIVKIAPDLYRANDGNWYTIFLVTPAGIVLGDPLNVPFAQWLEGELESRFHQPVRYVVYSHSHFDHAEGGRGFADTAIFVAHENMLRNLDGRYPQMPGDMVDRNDNGVIDPEEIAIPTNSRRGDCGMYDGWFATRDYDGNGRISPQELQRDIVRPTLVYSERMRIELGGQVIELVHPGLNHSDDATVMLFPRQRVLFATEFLADALVKTTIRSLPSACGPFDGSPLAEWIKSYRTVEALDFDLLAGGHGASLFAKADVTATREYFEDLAGAVSAGMQAGRSLEELKRDIKLDKYHDWAHFERLRPYNVEAAYRNLKLYR